MQLTQNTPSKIVMAAEIIEAMKFLGIDTNKMRSMRVNAGSLAALHAKLANKLGA